MAAPKSFVKTAASTIQAQPLLAVNKRCYGFILSTRRTRWHRFPTCSKENLQQVIPMGSDHTHAHRGVAATPMPWVVSYKTHPTKVSLVSGLSFNELVDGG